MNDVMSEKILIYIQFCTNISLSILFNLSFFVANNESIQISTNYVFLLICHNFNMKFLFHDEIRLEEFIMSVKFLIIIFLIYIFLYKYDCLTSHCMSKFIMCFSCFF